MDEIRKMINERMSKGSSIEDILDEIANVANEIKDEEDTKTSKIDNALSVASDALTDAAELMAGDKYDKIIEEFFSPKSLHFILEMAIDVANQDMTSLLSPFSIFKDIDKPKHECHCKDKATKNPDEIISEHIRKLFG